MNLEQKKIPKSWKIDIETQEAFRNSSRHGQEEHLYNIIKMWKHKAKKKY